MALVFMFFVEHLGVWETPPPARDPFRPAVSGPGLGRPLPRAMVRERAAVRLAWVVGRPPRTGDRLRRSPSPRHGPGDARGSARTVTVDRSDRPGGLLHQLRLLPATATGETTENALLLSAAGSGRYVLFEHDQHQKRLGARFSSCRRCHHLNVSLDKATPCAACHRDMYATTDTFGHERHVATLGRNASCSRCHLPGKANTREASTPCAIVPRRGRRPARRPGERTTLPAGIAPGYRQALHALCISCHRAEEARTSRKPYLSRCPACHRGAAAGDENLRAREGAVLLARR